MRSLLACCLVLLAVGFLAGSADARTLGSRTLQAGMTGSDVQSLQVGLTHRGYRVPATGKFGATSMVRRSLGKMPKLGRNVMIPPR